MGRPEYGDQNEKAEEEERNLLVLNDLVRSDQHRCAQCDEDIAR